MEVGWTMGGMRARTHAQLSNPRRMKIPCLFILFSLERLVFYAALATDSDLLQDLCVADLTPPVKVNGFACEPATSINETDFTSAILATAGDTNTTTGVKGTAATVEKVPGLNTLGISMARLDYAPGGLNPPHTHPRATEMLFVLEGGLDVGFITTTNKLVMKTVSKGEVFVFPRGMVHFQKNNGETPAAALAAFNGQLAGTQFVATMLFAASSMVPDDVLAKAFQVGTEEVEKIKERLALKK